MRVPNFELNRSHAATNAGGERTEIVKPPIDTSTRAVLRLHRTREGFWLRNEGAARFGIALAALASATVLQVGCSGAPGDPDAGTTDGAVAAPEAGCPAEGCNTTPVLPSPTCTDGIRNASETGIDCGGSCPLKCSGDPCESGSECKSGSCASKLCTAAGVRSCGEGKAPCVDGETCVSDGDCASDYCRASTCMAPLPGAHTDGRRNAGETGVDCGGAALPERACARGQACKSSNDCLSSCEAGLCEAPSDRDGKKNQGETDVDCGGPYARACSTGKTCTAISDCELASCKAGTCTVPTSSDGTKNAAETDVDCGGGTFTAGTFNLLAPRCSTYSACLVGSDCKSGLCNGGVCVPPSCATTESAGITTCGAGEVGTAGARHETCCKALPLPTRAGRRLDKYEITAGRVRTFANQVGPNVRAWALAYVAAHPTSQLASFMTMSPVLADLLPSSATGRLNLSAQLGAIDMDSYNGNRGCYMGYDPTTPNVGSYGQSTYFQDAATLAQYGIPPRVVPRETLDQKPATCMTPLFLATFCAWDGDGELAKRDDYLDAWGEYLFPWGPLDIARPNYNFCNGRPGDGGNGFACSDTSLGDGGVFYRFPLGVDEARDVTSRIAAPGRFVRDATSVTVKGEAWMDLFANLAETTGDFDFSGPPIDFCDFSGSPEPGATTCTREGGKPPGSVGTLYTGIPRAGIIGQTFEGHEYFRGGPGFPATFQYGKFGGRCARPVD